MKQAVSEKHSVAWFKLAEFVSRGEKERALSLYRLLVHSLDDQAFIRQLEGDLLLSFNDETSFDRYAEAVRLYAKSQRMTEAAAIYEHLITLEPTTTQHLAKLADLYKELPHDVRTFEATQHHLRVLLSKHEFEKASAVLQELDPEATQFTTVHQELVQAWLKIEDPPTDSLMVHVKKIIDFHFSSKQQKALQTFLMTLKMLHTMLYQEACMYLQDGGVKS